MREGGCFGLLWGGCWRGEERETVIGGGVGKRGVDEGEDIPGRIPLRVRKAETEVEIICTWLWRMVVVEPCKL